MSPRFLGRVGQRDDDRSNILLEVMARLHADGFHRLKLYVEMRRTNPHAERLPAFGVSWQLEHAVTPGMGGSAGMITFAMPSYHVATAVVALGIGFGAAGLVRAQNTSASAERRK